MIRNMVKNRLKFRKNYKFIILFFVSALMVVACGPNPSSISENGFGRTSPVIGDRAVARVDGTLITIMDIEREAARQDIIQPGATLAADTSDYSRILDELIDQRLLALEAMRRGLDQDDEARIRLGVARERILGNILVERVVADAVTGTSIQRLYQEQAKLAEPAEEVRARHILVATKEEAENLRKVLLEGGTFAALAFELSKDTATRLEGGDLGYFTRDAMVDPFAEAAFSLKIDEISEPVETKYGWHIIQVKARRTVKTPSLEEMRPRLVRFMTFDEIQKLVTELTLKAKVEHLESQVPPVPEISVPGQTDPSDEQDEPASDEPGESF